jgi:hypothetical protein
LDYADRKATRLQEVSLAQLNEFGGGRLEQTFHINPPIRLTVICLFLLGFGKFRTVKTDLEISTGQTLDI